MSDVVGFVYFILIHSDKNQSWNDHLWSIRVTTHASSLRIRLFSGNHHPLLIRLHIIIDVQVLFQSPHDELSEQYLPTMVGIDLAKLLIHIFDGFRDPFVEDLLDAGCTEFLFGNAVVIPGVDSKMDIALWIMILPQV